MPIRFARLRPVAADVAPPRSTAPPSSRELRSNGLFLIKWLAIAYVLEALLVAYVPASLIAGLVGGDGVAPVAIAAVFGMPHISAAMWRRPCSPD